MMNFQALYFPVSKFNRDELTRRVRKSVYSKFIELLAASCGGRGSAGSQDSGSNMDHLWFVVQIWAKWSYIMYKTIFIV